MINEKSKIKKILMNMYESYFLIRKNDISEFEIKIIKTLRNKYESYFFSRKNEISEFAEMDQDLLGATIRHSAHRLDKVIRMKWSEGRGRRYKDKLERALMIWRRNGFKISDDISWAEVILHKYDEWNIQKTPFFSKIQYTELMNIFDVIKQRRSIRYFKHKDIEKAKILKVLEAGMWAPSSGNRQTWRFIVKKRVITEIGPKLELSFQKEKWRGGSVIIYVAIDSRPYGLKEKYAGALDAGAAIQNMLLMAHSIGLGGYWSYMADLVDQNNLRKLLELSDYYYVYSAILLGYPVGYPEAPGRKPLERIAKFLIEPDS